MQNVADVFNVWPSDAEVARDIGVSYPTVSSWKQRGSIPVGYWRRVIRAAARRGHPEVTAELLVDIHAAESRSTSREFAEGESPYLTEEEHQDRDRRPPRSGHFSRYKNLRRGNFNSSEEVEDHIRALREEWRS